MIGVIPAAGLGTRMSRLTRGPKELLPVWKKPNRPLGLADAISKCSNYVKNSMFAVLLPDNIFIGNSPLKRLIDVAERSRKGVVALEYTDRLRGKTPGELDDVPVLQAMAKEGRLLGVLVRGKGFDVGNPKAYRHAESYFQS